MNTAIPSSQGKPVAPSSSEKGSVSRGSTQPVEADISSSAATLSNHRKKNSLAISHTTPQAARGATFVAARKAPEIPPPENGSIELIEILRTFQISFCTADVSQAEGNAKRVQEELKIQNQQILNNIRDTDTKQKQMAKWSKIIEIASKVLSFLAVAALASAILSATGVGAIAFATVVGLLAVTTLILSYLPKGCLGTRTDIRGKTVNIEPTLGGLVDYLCDKTILLTHRVEGVEGGPKNGPFLTKQEYENYKFGWTLGVTVLIALPTIIYGGVQLARAFAQGAEKVIETASKSLIEVMAGGKFAAVFGTTTGVGQIVTALTAIGMATGNAYIAGDRRDLAGMGIQKEEINKIVTDLQTRFQMNHEYFEGTLSFQETLRKTIADAIANYIEMSAKISKNHA